MKPEYIEWRDRTTKVLIRRLYGNGYVDAYERQQKSEEKFRSVIDSMPDITGELVGFGIGLTSRSPPTFGSEITGELQSIAATFLGSACAAVVDAVVESRKGGYEFKPIDIDNWAWAEIAARVYPEIDKGVFEVSKQAKKKKSNNKSV